MCPGFAVWLRLWFVYPPAQRITRPLDHWHCLGIQICAQRNKTSQRLRMCHTGANFRRLAQDLAAHTAAPSRAGPDLWRMHAWLPPSSRSPEDAEVVPRVPHWNRFSCSLGHTALPAREVIYVYPQRGKDSCPTGRIASPPDAAEKEQPNDTITRKSACRLDGTPTSDRTSPF